jgi:hypothetical protein
VNKEVASDATEIEVAIFKRDKPNTTKFLLHEDEATIMTVQVISSIDLEQETKKHVTVTKKVVQEVQRLLTRMYDQICEALNAKSDEEASKEAEEADAHESEEEEEESPVLKTRVKAPRKAAAQTQAANKSAPAKIEKTATNTDR